MTEERRKELLAKKDYYRKHPEEARKAYLKKVDDYVPVGTPPKKKKKDG